ncbi:MAG: hypothetical protein SFT92_05380 [Rickettsiales bacterium]|nr:hypothetical protein [Rickettsiales bacterium]
MNNQSCSTADGKKCPIKCLIPLIAAFATLFGFQWVYHGIYMMPDYQATAALWRPEADMQNLWWVCIATKLVMAGVICCLYCCMAKSCPSQGKCVKKGAIFGFKIGLLLGAACFASYIWLPISLNMAIKWLVGDIIMGVLVGVVLALTCRICKK